MNSLTTFLSELTRRKVWLFGGIYLALGWVLLQVAIAVETTLSLPGWVDQITLVLLGLGFPVALLLAWAQESGSGEPQTDDGLEAPSPLSIAVLPFADMSPDGDQDWFSDGISEELLHRLAAEKQLTVTSRTSSFYFKDKGEPIEKIGKFLKVASVVEGSVRKDDNRVRITAQLIDINTGAHKWSGAFDRELEDIFRIQQDISTAIVHEMLRELGVEPTAPETKPYEPNIEAYQSYLRAYQMMGSLTYEGLTEAARLYKRAAELDPQYLVPVAALISFLENNQHVSEVLSKEEFYDLEFLRDEAMRRNPSPFETLFLKATEAYHDWQYIEADEYYREMMTLPDAMEEGKFLFASYLLYTGRGGEAISLLELLLRGSPFDRLIHNKLAEAYFFEGRNKELIDLADSSRELGTSSALTTFYVAWVEGKQGNMTRLDELIASSNGNSSPRVIRAYLADDKEAMVKFRNNYLAQYQKTNKAENTDALATLYLVLGDKEVALSWYEKVVDAKLQSFRSLVSNRNLPARRFLLSEPRGRKLLEDAGYDLAWFDDLEGNQ